MDTPLLALTRGRATGPDPTASDNMRQLIQLRWLAVAGQLVTVVFVRFGLGIPLPLAPLLAVVAGLALANLAFALLLPRHRMRNAEMLGALLFDVGALSLQLYFTGGATNPFISLFLVQVVLGAILLESWSVWVLVATACASYATLTFAHVPLTFPARLASDIGGLYTLGAWLSFALVSALLVLFSIRITRNLRARDAYLADLRQRAAEEDHLVRMGLFASGAAHELGTPLATLSVILGDWRRLPKLAGDPELAAEIADMQLEVQRCKAIVSDILHTAGQSRGEAIGRAPAALFLDEAVAAWREHLHQPVPLAYARDGLEGATLVADPALRQAIWNILDNAAEASPAGVALRAERRDGQLAIAISDRGPGFPPEALASLGKPARSRKGEGHGMGLFLTVNVARRLGGGLHAANRPEGGAEVALTVPLQGD